LVLFDPVTSAMKLDSVTIVAAFAGASLWLHGCSDPYPQDWPGPTAVPPDGKPGKETTTPKPDHPPQSDSKTAPTEASKLAGELNQQFRGFDPEQDSSPLGVTITWLKDQDKKLNLYCPDVPRNDADGCFDGSSTCRMSAVQHTPRTAVTKDENDVMKVIQFQKRNVGVVFNFELVNNFFGKCAYAYDGGSNFRYNHGCGQGAGSATKESCDDPNGAFNNQCKSTGKTCTAADPEVEGGSCDTLSGGHAVDETTKSCFYKLPSYDLDEADILTHYTGKSDVTNQLRTMMQDRVKMDLNRDCGEECWNEVIIDERLLLTQLWWDPLSAVSAIVYATGVEDAERAPSQAHDIQAAFKKDWGVEPPILAMNIGCNVYDEGCVMFSAPATATFA
jgi:hypothetical protein